MADVTQVSTLYQKGQLYLRGVLASDFVRKVIETFGARVLSIGIGLITSVIVARILGPDGRGIYATAMTITAIGIQFGNVGLHASNTYYVAQDRSLLGPLIANSLWVSLGIGGLAAILAAIVFGIWPDIAPVQGIILGLALLRIPFGLAYLLVQNLLLGIDAIRAYNTIGLAVQVMVVPVIGVVILLRLVSPVSIYLVFLMLAIVSSTWVTVYLIRQLKVWRFDWSTKLFGQGIRYGFKAYVAAFFAFLVLRSDLLMVKQLLGAEEAGHYSIAVTIADMLYLLPTVIGSLLFPKLTADSNEREKWRNTQKVAALVFFGMSVLLLLSVPLAEPLIGLVYGKAYLPSIPAFIMLLPAVLALSVNTIFMNYFASIGMPTITVYSPGFALVINIFCNFWLIPTFGIVGASISSIVAYAFMLAASLIYLRFNTTRLNA